MKRIHRLDEREDETYQYEINQNNLTNFPFQGILH